MFHLYLTGCCKIWFYRTFYCGLPSLYHASDHWFIVASIHFWALYPVSVFGRISRQYCVSIDVPTWYCWCNAHLPDLKNVRNTAQKRCYSWHAVAYFGTRLSLSFSLSLSVRLMADTIICYLFQSALLPGFTVLNSQCAAYIVLVLTIDTCFIEEQNPVFILTFIFYQSSGFPLHFLFCLFALTFSCNTQTNQDLSTFKYTIS